jgi:hypothetical protein
MIPSRKTILDRLDWLDKLRDLTPEQAATIVRQAMEYAETGEMRPTLDKYVEDHRIGFLARAYSARSDTAMEIMDRALETSGIEYIPSNEDTSYSAYGLEYLNTGDTYTATVIYDRGEGKWMITSWGDVVESDDERFGADAGVW